MSEGEKPSPDVPKFPIEFLWKVAKQVNFSWRSTKDVKLFNELSQAMFPGISYDKKNRKDFFNWVIAPAVRKQYALTSYKYLDGAKKKFGDELEIKPLRECDGMAWSKWGWLQKTGKMIRQSKRQRFGG